MVPYPSYQAEVSLRFLSFALLLDNRPGLSGCVVRDSDRPHASLLSWSGSRMIFSDHLGIQGERNGMGAVPSITFLGGWLR